MGSMRNWMWGAALVVGGLGAGAATAQAAEWGVYVGGPAAYVPPCPGPGYEWVAGYYADGYWVPGQWIFAGGGDWDHGRFWRHDGYWDHDRRWERERRWNRDGEQGWRRDGHPDRFRR